MRERIVKQSVKRGRTDIKEVALRINKSGLNAEGHQRFVVAVRFTDNSYKKVSNTGYVAVEIDRDMSRLYFVPSSNEVGYKLSCSRGGSFKSITFTVADIDEWRGYVGDYNLLKDVDENVYYIDLRKGETK